MIIYDHVAYLPHVNVATLLLYVLLRNL